MARSGPLSGRVALLTGAGGTAEELTSGDVRPPGPSQVPERPRSHVHGPLAC